MTSRLKAVLVATAWLASASTTHATVLSDNLGAVSFFSEGAGANYWVAASFGTDAQAYELTSVVLLMGGGPVSNAAVEIYTSAGAGVGQPGSLVGILELPVSEPVGKSNVTFTATGILLSPSATYWVVLRSTLGGEYYNWYWAMDNTGTGVGFQHTWGYSEDAGASWTTFDGGPMVMQVNAEPVPWIDLGFALPGVSGAPHLHGTGTLQAGTTGSLQLSSAAPSAPALLFISTTVAATPFKGGTLMPLPFELALSVPTDALGECLVPWAAWPPGLSGLSLFFQAAIQDTAAAKGVALSNALVADVP